MFADRVSVLLPSFRHEHVYVHATTTSSRQAGQGAVIDRVIKYLAILLAESLVATERVEPRVPLFLLRGLTWRRLHRPETDDVVIYGRDSGRNRTKKSLLARLFRSATSHERTWSRDAHAKSIFSSKSSPQMREQEERHETTLIAKEKNNNVVSE